MEALEVKKFKKELLNLKMKDLRNKNLMGGLEEIRMVLVDIFSMFKIKSIPLVIKKE